MWKTLIPSLFAFSQMIAMYASIICKNMWIKEGGDISQHPDEIVCWVQKWSSCNIAWQSHWMQFTFNYKRVIWFEFVYLHLYMQWQNVQITHSRVGLRVYVHYLRSGTLVPMRNISPNKCWFSFNTSCVDLKSLFWAKNSQLQKCWCSTGYHFKQEFTDRLTALGSIQVQLISKFVMAKRLTTLKV